MSDQSGAIRAGIAANLAGLAGVQVSPYMLANPTPPFAYITEGEIDYDQAMDGGLDELEFTIVIGVQFTTDQGSEIALDAFRDPLAGVKRLVETDQTLGGACDTCRVSKASEPKIYNRDGGPAVLGCEFTVEVYAPRTL